jgi:cobalt-zinc-cadmium efflux system membrane fusion protein
MNRNHRRAAVRDLLAAVAALGLLACGEKPQAEAAPVAAPAVAEPLTVRSPRASFVKVEQIKSEPDTEMSAATGKVAFNEDVTSHIGSPVSGRVLLLHVQPGDKVKKGQPLVTLASPEVEAARAEAIQATSDQQVATRALERAQRLFADGAVPKKDLQQAEEDLVKARSNTDRTTSRLQLLGVPRDTFSANYVIRAPIDGTVVERLVSPGQEVRGDTGAPLLTVAELKTLWVLVDLYERDLSRAKIGGLAEVHVSAYPADTFKGTVTHIGEVVDPTSRTVKVRLSVDNKDGRLKPEMFARVSLLQKTEPVMSLPTQAVLSDGEKSQVITVTDDGHFKPQPVEVGVERDGRVRILGGLNPGDKVVVEGALFVKNELSGG